MHTHWAKEGYAAVSGRAFAAGNVVFQAWQCSCVERGVFGVFFLGLELARLSKVSRVPVFSLFSHLHVRATFSCLLRVLGFCGLGVLGHVSRH